MSEEKRGSKREMGLEEESQMLAEAHDSRAKYIEDLQKRAQVLQSLEEAGHVENPRFVIPMIGKENKKFVGTIELPQERRRKIEKIKLEEKEQLSDFALRAMEKLRDINTEVRHIQDVIDISGWDELFASHMAVFQSVVEQCIRAEDITVGEGKPSQWDEIHEHIVHDISPVITGIKYAHFIPKFIESIEKGENIKEKKENIQDTWKIVYRKWKQYNLIARDIYCRAYEMVHGWGSIPEGEMKETFISEVGIEEILDVMKEYVEDIVLKRQKEDKLEQQKRDSGDGNPEYVFFEKKGFTIDIDPTIVQRLSEIKIFVNDGKVFNTIANFISNVINKPNIGASHVILKVRLEQQDDQEWLIFGIDDNGKGAELLADDPDRIETLQAMSDEERRIVLDELFFGLKSTTQEYGGKGRGLLAVPDRNKGMEYHGMKPWLRVDTVVKGLDEVLVYDTRVDEIVTGTERQQRSGNTYVSLGYPIVTSKK